MEPKVEPEVEPRIEATAPPTSNPVREVLIDAGAHAIIIQTAIMIGCGLGTVIGLALSLTHLGARAPVDLRYLCVVIAFGLTGIIAFVAKRRTLAFLRRVTAQDLVGFTPNADKSLWLHFRNGRTMRTSPLKLDLTPIEAAVPKRPPPPKIRAAAVAAWAVFLAPLGVGMWLREMPFPVQVSQVESTPGRLAITGNAVLIADAFVRKGGTEYGTLWVTDASGHCRVLVKADAIPGTERLRHEPGLPVRVVVHSEDVHYEGQLMEYINVLIAHSLEVLEP